MIIRKGLVYYKSEYAGMLEETPSGGTRFAYDDNCKISIGCSLPRHKQVHEWPIGIHPFFENLCPEGWLRAKQARVRHLQIEDSLGILLNYGEDCIGAIGIKNSQPEILIDESKLDSETSSAAAHRTMSGVQRKLLAYQDGENYHPATKKSLATHIAKFNHPDNDTLVQNELLSLKLAKDVLGNTNVTKFEFTYLKELDEVALIIERFDRSENIKKLRMEEFAQILNKPCGKSFSGKYNGSYEEIGLAIKEYSSRPEIDLDLFFRQIVFTVLVGNCDAHFKNFALLESHTGLRLAPAYDILNTLLYPEKGYSSIIGLEICGKKYQWSKIDRKIITEFGRNIGLKDTAMNLALSEIERNLQKTTCLEQHPLSSPDDFKGRYKQILDSAWLRILE